MINFKEYVALCSKYLTNERRGKEGRFYKDHIYICDFTDYDTVVAWFDVYISKTDNTIETSLEGKEYASIKDFRKDLNIFVEKYKKLKKELRLKKIEKL